MCLKKQGFIFIETIIVICVLTVGLMSLYNNYSKIVKNTKELNTYDTAEYNYKTYFLKEIYNKNRTSVTIDTNFNIDYNDSLKNKCTNFNGTNMNLVKICILESVSTKLTNLTSSFSNLDAYIIDYINSQDLTTDNDNLFIAEFKKEDKQNRGEYLTYISSLTY